MRDFVLRVFAASGTGTSAGATTLAVNTKSNSPAFKRLISSTGYRLRDPVLAIVDEQELPPSRGAATTGKSNLPNFTICERIRRAYGSCRFCVRMWQNGTKPVTARESAFDPRRTFALAENKVGRCGAFEPREAVSATTIRLA